MTLSLLDRPAVPGVRWSTPDQWMVKVRPLGHVHEHLVPALVEAVMTSLAGWRAEQQATLRRLVAVPETVAEMRVLARFQEGLIRDRTRLINRLRFLLRCGRAYPPVCPGRARGCGWIARTAEYLDREAPISAGSVRSADAPLPGKQSEEGDQGLFADRRCKELGVGRLNRDDSPLRKYCALRADRESTDTGVGRMRRARHEPSYLQRAQNLRGHHRIRAGVLRQSTLTERLARRLGPPPKAREQDELDVSETKRAKRRRHQSLPAEGRPPKQEALAIARFEPLRTIENGD